MDTFNNTNMSGSSAISVTADNNLLSSDVKSNARDLSGSMEMTTFLKGYAIVTIIGYHYLHIMELPDIFDKALNFIGGSMPLYFFLSGFGLYYSYQSKPLSYAGFLRKRLSKVYIPYLLLVSIAALISIFIPIYENSLYAFGGHVFLYKMFDSTITESYGYQLWFISTIIQFYFVFYILALLKDYLGNKFFLLFCIALSMLWGGLVIYLGKENLRSWNSAFFQFLWEFALGMALASLHKNGQLKEIKLNRVYLLLLTVTGAAFYGILGTQFGQTGRLFNDIPAFVGYSALPVCIYLYHNKWINRFFVFSGNISYPLYLVHMLVLSISVHYLHTYIPVYVLIGIAFSLCYCISVYYQRFTDGMHIFLTKNRII